MEEIVCFLGFLFSGFEVLRFAGMARTLLPVGHRRRTIIGLSTCARGCRVLPLGLLGGLSGPVGGLAGSGGGSSPVVSASGASGSAAGGTSTIPVTGRGTSEAGSGGVPVTTGLLEAGLDGGGTLLVNTGELLLLDLVLGLGLRVAV